MSILIKDMEMPKPGRYEAVIIVLDKATAEIAISPAEDDIGYWKEYPLVPVSPHGDLIDQDEYRDEFMNGVYELCSDDSDNYRANAIIDLFDEAPTIIPASEEATDG